MYNHICSRNIIISCSFPIGGKMIASTNRDSDSLHLVATTHYDEYLIRAIKSREVRFGNGVNLLYDIALPRAFDERYSPLSSAFNRFSVYIPDTNRCKSFVIVNTEISRLDKYKKSTSNRTRDLLRVFVKKLYNPTNKRKQIYFFNPTITENEISVNCFIDFCTLCDPVRPNKVTCAGNPLMTTCSTCQNKCPHKELLENHGTKICTRCGLHNFRR